MAQLHNNRATAHHKLGHLEAVREDAQRATELQPQWGQPQIRLAEMYYDKGKYQKAVTRLEIALGLANAAHDRAMVQDIESKLATYRFDNAQVQRRESENLAYGPTRDAEGAFRAAAQAMQGLDPSEDPMALLHKMASLDMTGTGMESHKHVIMAKIAAQEGRLADSAREFLAAAVAGNPEGMYNYGVYLSRGRGTRKNVEEAIRWFEKAAAMPVCDDPAGKFLNVGIGEALCALGNCYENGIHYHQNKLRAKQYWEESAKLGVSSGLNNLGMCLMNGTHGEERDLPRARDLLRQSAELQNNDAMSNMAALHASLCDFEAAARWAESAYKYGFVPAAEEAAWYRECAAQLAAMSPKMQKEATKMAEPLSKSKHVDMARENATPTLEELEAIDTPYGRRLLSAKRSMMEAMELLETNKSEDCFDHVLALATAAHRVDDSGLVFSEAELQFSQVMGHLSTTIGVTMTADLAHLCEPADPSARITYWVSKQRQFPSDLAITKRAGCILMFEGHAGANSQRGLELLQKAFTLLPNPHDDSDPATLDLLYLTAVGYHYATDHERPETLDRWELQKRMEPLKRAEALFTRFLKHAPADGHRKCAEAQFFLAEAAFMTCTMKKTSDLSEIVQHYERGEELLATLRPFLRGPAAKSPHRQMIQRILRTAGKLTNPPSKPPSMKGSQRHGGELVDGPRRHIKLQSSSRYFQTKWRGEIAKMSVGAQRLPNLVFSSTRPPKMFSARTSRLQHTPATVDELFSALADHVYTGRLLKCIVVSLPSFNGSSFHFVVEDSQREPTKIAVYNAAEALITQLLPGRVFHLLDPYVRIARDSSIMLRVDAPSSTIKVQSFHKICWVCSLEETQRSTLKQCAKCHEAIYCSKQCQKHDWTVDGHRFLCSGVSKMPTTVNPPAPHHGDSRRATKTGAQAVRPETMVKTPTTVINNAALEPVAAPSTVLIDSERGEAARTQREKSRKEAPMQEAIVYHDGTDKAVKRVSDEEATSSCAIS